MKKSISKSFVLLGMAALCATSLFFGLSTITNSTTYADTTQEQVSQASDTSPLNINVYTHDSALLTGPEDSGIVKLKSQTNEAEDQDVKYETYKWRAVHNFKISLNTDSLVETDSYSYSYSVSWTPALISNGIAEFDTDHTITAELFKPETAVSSKDDIVKEIYFSIDNNTINKANSYIANDKFGEKYKKHGGFGLYIFTFQEPATGANQSQIFQLLPDSVEDLSKPIISAKPISSNERINDAFLFSVDASYKYVDRNLIYWSVTGTGRDGRSYVLTPKDITNPNTTNSVFPNESVERTGITFSFDPKIEGTWKATCQIFKGSEDTAPYATAVSEKVSTVEGISSQALIWIVAGSAAAAGLVVAVIIVVSIKKERVY